MSDSERLRWVRSLPCCYCGATSDIQAHHTTHSPDRGMSLKASDADTFPLCSTCHMSFHGVCGPFRGWDKEKRHQWQDSMVLRYSSKSDPSFF